MHSRQNWAVTCLHISAKILVGATVNVILRVYITKCAVGVLYHEGYNVRRFVIYAEKYIILYTDIHNCVFRYTHVRTHPHK